MQVRDLRLKKNMSLDDLAETSGVAKGHISSIERGRAVMNLETAAKIARGLQIEVLDMFVFPEDEPRHAFIERTRHMSASEQRECLDYAERTAAANGRNGRRGPRGGRAR
jgi:transcriptional regulator with XRE-family HTH domain